MNENDEGNAAMSGKPSVATTDLTAGASSSAAPVLSCAHHPARSQQNVCCDGRTARRLHHYRQN